MLIQVPALQAVQVVVVAVTNTQHKFMLAVRRRQAVKVLQAVTATIAHLRMRQVVAVVRQPLAVTQQQLPQATAVQVGQQI
jgi:aspartate/glutamate racemase